MEGKAMLAAQETRACSGESWPVGEPVTLVIDEERFLGGSRLHRQPTVSRALLLSSNEAPTGSRNAFRLKIYRGSEIIYTRIRITHDEGERSAVGQD